MESKFKLVSLKIIHEIEKVIKEHDIALEELEDEIIKKNRIFLTGAGRTGLIMKSFGIRLMHLGFDVFMVGDINTPSINKKDLLIVGSGSGETTSLVGISEKAKKLGVKIILFTINDSSTIAQLVDRCFVIHAPSPKLESNHILKSIQPMGNLFEQILMIILDSITMILIEKIGIKSDKMFSRHANLE